MLLLRLKMALKARFGLTDAKLQAYRCADFSAVVPGAIGARRIERLPRYFWRSCILVSVFSIPSVALQMFAGSILLAVGVPAVNAEGVGVYCRIMVATAWLTLLDNHLEVLVINTGYVKTAALNALICGLGVEVNKSLARVLRCRCLVVV